MINLKDKTTLERLMNMLEYVFGTRNRKESEKEKI